MTFAEKLKELRRAAGLTQHGLAEKGGFPFGTVSNYEQGIRLPTFPAVVKLAAALGVSCEAFSDCDDVSGPAAAPEPAPPPEPPRPAGKRK